MQTIRLWTCGRVLDHHHVLALRAAVAQFGDRGGGVFEQPLFVGRIGPGAGHHSRAVARADFVLVVIHQGVERGAVHQPFFDQQGFERFHAQREVGGDSLMVVIVMVVRHGGLLMNIQRRADQSTQTQSRLC